jgi:uncharacterized protein YcbK (DUF882 family)
MGKGETPLRKDRRRFLKLGVLVIGGSLIPLPIWASSQRYLPPNRSLAFYHTHTDERLHVAYCRRGIYSKSALRKVNHILRDHRTDAIRPIDTELLDALFKLSRKLDTDEPFHVVSAYRSPATNARLRRRNNGVAKQSFHISGKAIDIRLPGARLGELRNTAMKLKIGGVGFYPRSDFIHLDVGPIRFW